MADRSNLPVARVTITPNPSKGCWQVFCGLDHVVVASCAIELEKPLTQADAIALFNAVCAEIGSWLF